MILCVIVKKISMKNSMTKFLTFDMKFMVFEHKTTKKYRLCLADNRSRPKFETFWKRMFQSNFWFAHFFDKCFWRFYIIFWNVGVHKILTHRAAKGRYEPQNMVWMWSFFTKLTKIKSYKKVFQKSEPTEIKFRTSISIKYKNYFDSHFYQGDFVTFAKLIIKTIIIIIDKISNYE